MIYLVYPGLSASHINIELGVLQKETEIKIYNSIGLVVDSKSTVQMKEIMDISNQPSGVYFIHIRRCAELEIHEIVKK